MQLGCLASVHHQHGIIMGAKGTNGNGCNRGNHIRAYSPKHISVVIN
jgi:hypothetical protein